MGLCLHCTRATDPREMGRLGWSGLVVRTVVVRTRVVRGYGSQVSGVG